MLKCNRQGSKGNGVVGVMKVRDEVLYRRAYSEHLYSPKQKAKVNLGEMANISDSNNCWSNTDNNTIKTSAKDGAMKVTFRFKSHFTVST